MKNDNGLLVMTLCFIFGFYQCLGSFELHTFSMFHYQLR